MKITYNLLIHTITHWYFLPPDQDVVHVKNYCQK